MAKKEEVYYNENGERVYPNKKKKRPFLFGCLGIIVLIFIIGGCAAVMTDGGSDSDDSSSDSHQKEKNISSDKRAALNSANTYADTMHMSKQGIYDQLISEDGDQFEEEDAQYAIDHLDVDFNKNALESAKSYQEDMDMSKQAIHDQLVSENGDKFTEEQAQYAIDNLD